MKLSAASLPTAAINAKTPQKAAPSTSPVFARYDAPSETFIYTQDGLNREVELRDPRKIAAATATATVAVTAIPLELIGQQLGLSTALNAAVALAGSAVSAALAGWAAHSFVKDSNNKVLQEAKGLGFCEEYQRFRESPLNRDVAQAQFQERLLQQLDPQSKGLVELGFVEDISKLDGKVPTLAQLQKEVDKLAARTDIPFEYIIDGCYSRAHLMCQELSERGWNNAKMFVNVKNQNQAGQTLDASNSLMSVSWNWHVAPLVFATDETNQVQPYIIDPSMSKQPLTPQEWVEKMWDKQDPIAVHVTRRDQYSPGPATRFDEWLGDSHKTLKDYSGKLEDIRQHGLPPNPPAKTGWLSAILPLAH